MHPVFFELFESLPRQGPGSPASTAQALALCSGIPTQPRILDLGCGAGAQTLELVRLTQGRITAVDVHAPLIELLEQRAAAQGLEAHVDARVAAMEQLALPTLGYDLVWSEGALYNLGLRKALPLCARQLRPGGFLAFSDAVWRHDAPAEPVRKMFADYPSMGRANDVLALLDELGWRTCGHFELPAAAWINLYEPMEARIEVLRRSYAGNPEYLNALDEVAEEPRIHREFGWQYGYDFFVAERPS